MEAEVFMSRLEFAGWTRSRQELEGPPEPEWGMRENPERWEKEREKAGRNESKLGLVIVGRRDGVD